MNPEQQAKKKAKETYAQFLVWTPRNKYKDLLKKNQGFLVPHYESDLITSEPGYYNALFTGQIKTFKLMTTRTRPDELCTFPAEMIKGIRLFVFSLIPSDILNTLRLKRNGPHAGTMYYLLMIESYLLYEDYYNGVYNTSSRSFFNETPAESEAEDEIHESKNVRSVNQKFKFLEKEFGIERGGNFLNKLRLNKILFTQILDSICDIDKTLEKHADSETKDHIVYESMPGTNKNMFIMHAKQAEVIDQLNNIYESEEQTIKSMTNVIKKMKKLSILMKSGSTFVKFMNIMTIHGDLLKLYMAVNERSVDDTTSKLI